MFESFETWEIVVGTLGLIVSATSVAFTFALKYFGGAFKHWGDKFDSFQTGVNRRLDHMEANVGARLQSMEERYRDSEDKYHRLTLQIERRVTWLEAHNSRNGISPESPIRTMLEKDA